jgi:RNA polymerase sigma factor (sigma-70 family)
MFRVLLARHFLMSIPIQALRDGDGPAWSSAYPWLWESGMAIARLRLAGERFELDREDLVSTALQQLIRGLVEKKEGSFNQIVTWDDCLGMMRHIVRSRVFDFLRSRQRSREDAMEELPEPAPDFKVEERFRLDELLPEVDRLQPDPPVPQVFRDRFIEGWSTDEIAARRGINRNTLLTYFAKGLRTLRERLTRLEGGLA